MNKYVIGDIHGAHKALVQVLARSNLDKENDTLITLGDIVDSFDNVGEVKETVEELLTIKNRIDIRGNHDDWFLDYFDRGQSPHYWLNQGGSITLKSYEEGIPESHKEFFRNQHYHYVDDLNRLFIHGGFDWKVGIKSTPRDQRMWDRHAFYTACQWEVYRLTHPTEKQNYFKEFKEVFVGHTSTTSQLPWRIGSTLEPLQVTNMWNLDQGAGGKGKLSIMNIDTKEYWQSDLTTDLYPIK